jgi:hypothetical protein
MEDREMTQIHKYGESKMTWIIMAAVHHMTSNSGLGKFQAAGFLFNRVYIWKFCVFLLKVYEIYKPQKNFGKLLWIYLMKTLRRNVRNEHVEEKDNKEDNEET